MPIISSVELRAIAKNNHSIIQKSMLNEKLGIENKKFDIFLSHSYLDKEIVEGIYHLLTSEGISVYVDWIEDAELDRNNITKETVQIVRERMRNSKSLVVAISNNVKESKWVPWELGFMDGFTNNCSIFPVSVNGADTFEGSEFFSVYPYITRWQSQFGTNRLWVVEKPRKYIVLDSWAKNRIQPIARSLQEAAIY